MSCRKRRNDRAVRLGTMREELSRLLAKCTETKSDRTIGWDCRTIARRPAPSYDNGFLCNELKKIEMVDESTFFAHAFPHSIESERLRRVPMYSTCFPCILAVNLSAQMIRRAVHIQATASGFENEAVSHLVLDADCLLRFLFLALLLITGILLFILSGCFLVLALLLITSILLFGPFGQRPPC